MNTDNKYSEIKSAESVNQRQSAIQTMKKYPKYKSSGVEWIGEIPEEWELKRLKYEVGYQKGKNPKELTFDEKGKTYLTMEYLRNSPKQIFFVEDFENYVSVSGNEILLLWDGSNAGEFIKSKEGILSSTMALIKIYNQNINYTWYFFKVFENLLRESTIGMGVPHVNGEEFKNQYFVVPPKAEQTAIANYLDDKTAKIDTLIEKKKKLIELLKEERTAVINEAVTKGLNYDSSDLPDYLDSKNHNNHNNQKNHSADKRSMKPSGIEWLGNIPEHWEVKKLKYVAKVNSESLTEKEDENLLIHYIDISSVDSDGNIISTTEYFYSDAPSRARRKVNVGDTILSTVRTYLKAIAFIEEANNNLICSTGFAVILPLDVFISKYLFYIFRSQIIIEKIMASSKGVSYPAIDSEDVRFISVWYPDKNEQLKIVQHIEAETKRIDETISKIDKEIELLAEYRTALISEVVTGKIKVC